MLSIAVCVVAVILFKNGICHALTTSANDGSPLLDPAPLISIPFPAAGRPGRSPNDISIQCEGSRFGTDVDYDSCLDAFRTSNSDQEIVPKWVSKRGTGPRRRSGEYLPWRWISGDGRCTFDVVLRGQVTSEETTGAEIARSAWKLMNECVRDQGVGGFTSGIGRTGALGIIVRKHDPSQIRCWPPPAAPRQHFPADKCKGFISHLVADVAPLKTWGLEGVPGVTEFLPKVYQAGSMPNCALRVFAGSLDVVDYMTYYDMWMAGNALVGMCGRFGLAGSNRAMGTNHKLGIQLDDGHGLGPSNGNESLMAKGTVVLVNGKNDDTLDQPVATS